MDSSKCTALTLKGKQCTRKALFGNLCRLHATIETPVYQFEGQCMTVTFSDVVENSIGMEQLGEKNDENGKMITPQYLRELSKTLENCKIHELNYTCSQKTEEACILVISNWLANPNDLLQELLQLDWDKKFLNKGSVMNKKARYNLCFTDENNEPCYEEGRGRVISFNNLPELSKARKKVKKLLPFDTTIYAEGNFYYDVSKTFIGFHGDKERSFVVGLRLGDDIPLHYRWFYRDKPVSDAQSITLQHGDLYIMSYKAVGNDWRKSSLVSLRHAAGNADLIKNIR